MIARFRSRYACPRWGRTFLGACSRRCANMAMARLGSHHRVRIQGRQPGCVFLIRVDQNPSLGVRLTLRHVSVLHATSGVTMAHSRMGNRWLKRRPQPALSLDALSALVSSHRPLLARAIQSLSILPTSSKLSTFSTSSLAVAPLSQPAQHVRLPILARASMYSKPSTLRRMATEVLN